MFLVDPVEFRRIEPGSFPPGRLIRQRLWLHRQFGDEG
jgi:hypothetical protein